MLTVAQKFNFVILLAGLSVPIDPESDGADDRIRNIDALLDTWKALENEYRCKVTLEDAHSWAFGYDGLLDLN